MLQLLKLLAYMLRMSRTLSYSRPALATAVATGLASGLCMTGLLAVISAALANGPRPRLVYGFVALCLALPACRLVSQGLFNVLTSQALFETRLQACRKILVAPLRRLEELGPHRLLASLAEDITIMTTALTQLPQLSLHSAIVLACLSYMGWLSWRLLLVILVVMALGGLSYSIAMDRARRYLRLLREEMDRMFAHFQTLIHGAKELKLHSRRRQDFVVSALIPTGSAIRRFSTTGSNIATAATVWSNLLFFIVIGLIVLGLPGRVSMTAQVMSGYTLALLYMLGPLEVIFQILPNLNRAATSMRKLEALGIDLASRATEAVDGVAAPVAGWRRHEMQDLSYTYSGDAESEHFGIGPLNQAFEAGETVFITGGNGSGKSTLGKLLTGLYVPDAGSLRVDGKAVTSENRESYRQLFSAVFADFYLFAGLIGDGAGDLDAMAREYLLRLGLDKKVKIAGGSLSNLDLSQGQRKRLALLVAYMEQRSIYLFDEWAADQDPHFKAIFYHDLLPDLKARGKTVFVISHDDQYYALADRLIKMKDGQIEWDRRQGAAAVAGGAVTRSAG